MRKHKKSETIGKKLSIAENEKPKKKGEKLLSTFIKEMQRIEIVGARATFTHINCWSSTTKTNEEAADAVNEETTRNSFYFRLQAVTFGHTQKKPYATHKKAYVFTVISLQTFFFGFLRFMEAFVVEHYESICDDGRLDTNLEHFCITEAEWVVRIEHALLCDFTKQISHLQWNRAWIFKIIVFLRLSQRI